MEINYFGTIGLTKSVLSIMQKQQKGHIVTISSLSGKFGFFLRSAYAASKFAQLGFFESLRLEEDKNNIDISIVFPGFINTEISKNALSGTGVRHGLQDQNQQNGISPEKCAQDIINGIIDNKHEIFSGGKEIWMVKIKRFFPNLFHKIIKKQSGT
jgi:short-subunit dehydrogenase